jgi:large exoprotein involved in heme utilization and adhesion
VTKTLLSCILRQLNITPLFQISLSTLGYLFLTSNISFAQVTSDGTVNTQVNQNGNVAEITGGETRGSNLFHSFQDFSVGIGDTASFESITLDDSSISSTASFDAEGNGGELNITTPNLSLTNGGSIDVDTFGQVDCCLS